MPFMRFPPDGVTRCWPPVPVLPAGWAAWAGPPGRGTAARAQDVTGELARARGLSNSSAAFTLSTASP